MYSVLQFKFSKLILHYRRATREPNVRGTTRNESVINFCWYALCSTHRWHSYHFWWQTTLRSEALFLKQQEQQNGRIHSLGFVHWWPLGMHTSEYCKMICKFAWNLDDDQQLVSICRTYIWILFLRDAVKKCWSSFLFSLRYFSTDELGSSFPGLLELH